MKNKVLSSKKRSETPEVTVRDVPFVYCVTSVTVLPYSSLTLESQVASLSLFSLNLCTRI